MGKDMIICYYLRVQRCVVCKTSILRALTKVVTESFRGWFP